MIIRLCIAALLCIFSSVSAQIPTESQECTAIAGLPLPQLFEKCSTDSSLIELSDLPIDKPQQKDSATTVNNDDDELLPLEQFTIAGDPRYTIDASLPRKTNKLKPLTTALVGGTYFGILTALHIYQEQTIWNKSHTFRFIEDGAQDFYADKGGHFWGAYFISYCSTEALIGSGFSYNNAILYGGLMGFGYQLYVEIMDGFGENWGFSTSDFIGDLAGFGYYLAQHYVPFLQNFTPKATYFPAPWYKEKSRLEASSFIDDYSSWTWWMSVNVYNLLPQTWQKYYPSWLELAFGYAVRDLRYDVTDNTYKGDKKFIISLDYNLGRLIPNTTNFLNWLRQCFNYFKFPAPAIEFGDTIKFNLFYPFKISTGNISF
jgi:hypothetical protein